MKEGDEVRLRLGPYEHILIVRELAGRRGPASVAQTLYEETEASRDERARLAAQLKMAPAAFVYEEKGRPTKKDRRDLVELHRPEASLSGSHELRRGKTPRLTDVSAVEPDGVEGDLRRVETRLLRGQRRFVDVLIRDFRRRESSALGATRAPARGRSPAAGDRPTESDD